MAVTTWWCLGLLAWVCNASGQQYRIPDDVRPRHYNLRLLYDIDLQTNFTYFGAVDIQLKAERTTSQIILHGGKYEIPEGTIKIKGDQAPQVTSFKYNSTYEMLTLDLDGDLQTNVDYILTIPFRGNLKKGDLVGAYISSYVDTKSKKTEYLVTTQFEALGARKAFPCFDEPIYKATFSMDIGHHNDYTAISNMPLNNSTREQLLEDLWPWTEIQKSFKKDKSEFKWDRFQKSVPMSSYLVAYVVSKFGYVSSQRASGPEFKTWAQKDVLYQAEFAAGVGPKVLEHFEKFYNVTYPLPKQDMIAIPDFSAGAMENWGLITYRETLMLYAPKQTSLSAKESIVSVIAHELAHQWFGNLVTMKWWSDLWLNEGFATYMATIGIEAVQPDWQTKAVDAVEQMLIILKLDSLESSHPVSVALDDPNRIGEIFDEISYKKGSILIRMMSMFLGEDVFRKAVHNYLVKYSYGNAEQDDLWRELTSTSMEYGVMTRNVTVKTIMDTWTTQTGYPLLTVNREYSDSTLTVSQKRYLNPGAKASTAVSWWVPLNVLCENEVGQRPHPVQWLADDEGVREEYSYDHGAKANEWVLFNYDMIAPYRVNYDRRNWQLLAKALHGEGKQTSAIPVLGRVQLLSDALALAWSNQLDYDTALKLTSYLQKEKEYLPLNAGLSGLQKIENVMKRSGDYGAFQKYIRHLITEQYQEAGGLAMKRIINEDDLLGVKLQTMTSKWACRAKVPGCEENAMQLFQEWMEESDPDNNNPIPLDLRATVSCTAVRRGSVREWRFVLERMRKATAPASRAVALRALACTHEVWIIAQFLEWTITDNRDVRHHEAPTIMSDLISNNVGYYVAKDFLYNRIEEIHASFGQSLTMKLGQVLKVLLNQFTRQNELDEFLEWRDKHAKLFEANKFRINQGIEEAKVNIAWISKNGKLVIDKMRELTS